VALNIADLEWTAEGVLIHIRRSKTDQEGLGQSVAVPRGATACPVCPIEKAHPPDDLCASRFAHPAAKNCSMAAPGQW
jgi:hypothetical protein